MPTYDYRCETTGDIYEVRHPMTLKISSWADLCDIGGFNSGTIPLNAAVTKLLNTADMISHTPRQKSKPQPCTECAGCHQDCGS
ncbi:zinc ribbon domain-containing protein [Amphritea opalescens]|uniref:Zinc ribbon domain-containing protein n=1 Tax=Amphritea opalescens TaxID=2490544 RepID=A0A430KUV5_9GAMM|nr:zinc ribbon domain-containing protein [Amphritea opalescens]RTE67114.1 zinc ribbon domain-containing protein [Amphritea opalescens]